LFTQISESQIKQLHEYSSTQHLVTIIRLLMFVWHCYQRQQLGLETSPLEVLTVGHVFMVILIEIFWWDKPPYLRLPVHNLDRQALCQAIPGLEQELDELAAARGKKTVNAYTSFPNSRVLLWLPTQDNVVGLRGRARWHSRSLIVFSLSACHSAILLFPVWRLSFPTPAETVFWEVCVAGLFLVSALVVVVAALDVIAGHVLEKAPGFMK
jgi:hypothetical protein